MGLMKYNDIAAVVMDMDGVLWRGSEPLPGLQEIFQWLLESGIPFALATNNSSRTPASYVEKLAAMGVPDIPEQAIVTSATATAAYLQTRYLAGTKLHVVGMNGLRQSLDAAGFDISGTHTEDDPVKAVVVGIDTDLTYEKLKQAALLIRAGADFIGTNPDKSLPAPEGQLPGAGSLLAALEAATDVSPTVIGKPEAPMFEAALKVVNAAPEKTLMIGDRLETDIAGAQKVGMKTALVFTGVTSAEQLSSAANSIWPDVAYEGLPELIKAWAGDAWYREKMKLKKGRV